MDQSHSELRATIKKIATIRKSHRRRHRWLVVLTTVVLFIVADIVSHILTKSDGYPASPHPWWTFLPACLAAGILAGPLAAWLLVCCACADYLWFQTMVPISFFGVRILALICIAAAYTVAYWSAPWHITEPALDRLARLFNRSPFTDRKQERIEYLGGQISL